MVWGACMCACSSAVCNGQQAMSVPQRWAPSNMDPAHCVRCSQVPGTTEVLEADIVLLAMGFLGPEATLSDALQVRCLDSRP